MEQQQHLSVINTSCRPIGAGRKFEKFSLLPPEVRYRIWQHSLKRYRLIEIGIDDLNEDEDEKENKARLYCTRNSLGQVVSGRNYRAVVRAPRLHSKLLRVSSDSRKAALLFYRVHIPCYLQGFQQRIHFDTLQGSRRYDVFPGRICKSTIYFNPEYDFIHLKGLYCQVKHAMVDFLHDVRAYDPRQIGLLNLALDKEGIAVLGSLEVISETPAGAGFINSLSRLQQIIWVPRCDHGRRVLGLLDCYLRVKPRFNHAMPVRSITPSFTLSQRDPREVEPDDLQYILTPCDPVRMHLDWQCMLRNWNIQQIQPATERVLFATEAGWDAPQVYDIESAGGFLKHEEEKWLHSQVYWERSIRRLVGRYPVEGPDELAKAVRPAIGFWLFPMEAFGSLAPGQEGTNKRFDMRGYWPELALSDLSERFRFPPQAEGS